MSQDATTGIGGRLARVEDCTGCGTCFGVCPVQAIAFTVDQRRGVFLPHIDQGVCTGCGVCTVSCPGLGLDIDSVAGALFGDAPKDRLIGHSTQCYLAHAADHDIRYGSASGGLVTALLILALEQGVIDGALVTRMSRDAPLTPEPFIARTKEEVIEAAKSKYCPVPANRALQLISRQEGRYAVVGLPCHLHGVRKAALADESLGRKIVLHLGLFCSHTLTFHATAHILRRLGLRQADVVEIAYRTRGWPGGLVVKCKDGSERFLPNQSAVWESVFASDFFTPEACLWCHDLTAELSDLSFGDPWLPEVINSERIGKSLVICRTSTGEDLMRVALERKSIEAIPIAPSAVRSSQNTFLKFKKDSICARERLGKQVTVSPSSRAEIDTRPMDRLLALVAILNSSLGRSRLFRGALDGMPQKLLTAHMLVLSRLRRRGVMTRDGE